ncbi:hypothetical protein Scep_004948 [Stephania cephalantha]|uniref:Uncharacterized protein n=1 Tax=Stephania cephalantha TaxID=152367 RepID=A0AAP0KV03_9MAGN
MRVPTISIPRVLECRRVDVMYQRFNDMTQSLEKEIGAEIHRTVQSRRTS